MFEAIIVSASDNSLNGMDRSTELLYWVSYQEAAIYIKLGDDDRPRGINAENWTRKEAPNPDYDAFFVYRYPMISGQDN
jgi:hypothetical protein